MLFVPIVGPILFFMYIDDIPLATKFYTTLYADYTKSQETKT